MMNRKFLATLMMVAMAGAATQASDIDPSGYSLYTGGDFYVLTDGVFSTNDEVKVRFEPGHNESLRDYGGVDVRLYRVPKPLDFLKSQKNLHRPDVKGQYEGEGLSNVLGYLWDSTFKKARLAWQRVFSPKARETVVKEVPSLKQIPAHTYQTRFSKENQFKPLSGMELVDAFRYPVWEAKKNEPPRDTTMEGSSSNFIETASGNVYLPMGKRKPGLYLVEAMIGAYRATTLVFVSNSLLVTKVSSNQALVWTVDKTTSMSAPGSKVMLTDGTGILAEGSGNADGVYTVKREIPERSFAMTEDRDGGVSISENFFYESETDLGKVFLFTDRPLYEPGDSVSVRAFGRKIQGTSAKLTILDAIGVPILSRSGAWKGLEGAGFQFQLPDSAESGGYTMKLSVDGNEYGGAFRVARFVKPHFDARIEYSKSSYKVGEAVNGKVVLTYPSGQPVVGAEVEIQLRAEKMTVYEGNYHYQGASPVELKKKVHHSNGKGEVAFSFPAATKPSRYLTSVRAFDQAVYRVTSKKDVLIEGYLETYLLSTEQNSSEPGKPVKFSFDRQGADAGDMTQKLASWQAIRLEDRKVSTGKIEETDRGSFEFTPDSPGHYVVRVVDAGGVTRGVRSHVVLGPDLKSTSGQIEILADKEAYSIGDTAVLLVAFPSKTDDALLTLERNEVSSWGRIGKGGSWFKSRRLGDSQWRIEVPVREAFAPNVVFSVASVTGGEFGFENKGLVVKKPALELTLTPNKKEFAPGEKVVVDLETRFGGKPVPALVAVGVVDEMIYVLQPELAPAIGDFFHHLRRNQVRTTSSQSFYSFNPAISSGPKAPETEAHRELKLLGERARRDGRDTAYWNGSLKTGANGKARFEFVMPDALTRWRMTARAIAIEGPAATKGAVGESKGYVLSNQPFFIKWTGPTRFRTGDQPRPAILAFNSGSAEVEGEISVKGKDFDFSTKLSLKPGVNPVLLDRFPRSSQDLEARLVAGGKPVDLLKTAIEFSPAAPQTTRSEFVKLDSGKFPALPKDASKIRLKVMSDASYQFQRVLDDLVDYPWGCVEQTSSRLIPLVMAAKGMLADRPNDPELKNLSDRISADRRRLVSMAGPNAAFSWWGDGTDGDLFMTAHAYHADFRASKFLGIEVPKEAWEHLLKIYAKDKSGSFLSKVYALWVVSYLGLPVTEQVKALLKDAPISIKPPELKTGSADQSVVLDARSYEDDLGLLVLAALAAKAKIELPMKMSLRMKFLSPDESSAPVFRAAALDLAVKSGKTANPASEIGSILESIRYETPTVDRALTLAFLEEASPGIPVSVRSALKTDLGKDWAPKGRMGFRYTGVGIPASLPKVPGATAEVIYDSSDSVKGTLPVEVTRKLYKVDFSAKNDKSDDGDDGEGVTLGADEVKPGEALDPRALYIDEIELSPGSGKHDFLFVEVPLLPGGETDGKTWGLKFKGLETNFVEARSAEGGNAYGIPVESLQNKQGFHQLVRFSSPGVYQLPPVRVSRMYRPGDRAFEKREGSGAITVR